MEFGVPGTQIFDHSNGDGRLIKLTANVPVVAYQAVN